jgi:hypothetical protein
MAKINNNPPKAPMWPWGGPRSVRDRLVDPTEFDRKKKVAKKGDPRNPALASTALLEFIGPGHTSDELRLPPPPFPEGHDADVEAFSDRPYLAAAAERADEEERRQIEKGLSRINAAPERLDRLKALLNRESQMLNVVAQLHAEMAEIQRRMREEQKTEGY